eukprot:3911690-Rhodomonas_salina.2
MQDMVPQYLRSVPRGPVVPQYPRSVPHVASEHRLGGSRPVPNAASEHRLGQYPDMALQHTPSQYRTGHGIADAHRPWTLQQATLF